MRYYNGENFDDLVKSGVHLIDFYADWCGPCKMLGTVLEEVQDSIDIIKVNTDSYGELANRFKVMSIPHLVFFKDGKEVSYSVGFMDKDTLLEKIEEVKEL
jgi:thioredoxin 1